MTEIVYPYTGGPAQGHLLYAMYDGPAEFLRACYHLPVEQAE